MSEAQVSVATADSGVDESQDVQGRLLDAAESCFAQYGLRKTSMEDVARAAGMSRATVYRHFKNRDDLLMGVVEREARQVSALIKERLRGIEHAADYMIEGMVQSLIEIPKCPTLSMIHSPEAYPITSRLLLNSERLANVALEIALPVIEPAREKGLLRQDVELGLMIEWIYRVLSSYLSVPSETAKSEDEIRMQLRAMLLPALLG